jgi:hypothetical protein
LRAHVRDPRRRRGAIVPRRRCVDPALERAQLVDLGLPEGRTIGVIPSLKPIALTPASSDARSTLRTVSSARGETRRVLTDIEVTMEIESERGRHPRRIAMRVDARTLASLDRRARAGRA